MEDIQLIDAFMTLRVDQPFLEGPIETAKAEAIRLINEASPEDRERVRMEWLQGEVSDQDIFEHIDEGNDKGDLIRWIMEVLNKDDLNEIRQDIMNQRTHTK